ncbi:MAG: hypothetical protein HFJ51_03355 [Clostridia bacterium]|nr:hypothetical protein [Clostridia bacterium]
MKTVYLKEKKPLTERRIRKLAKKLNKINKKENITVAISKELSESQELISEIKGYKIPILNRKMDFEIYAFRYFRKRRKI